MFGSFSFFSFFVFFFRILSHFSCSSHSSSSFYPAQEIKENVELLFKNGREIYIGYVDDPRNTDNAWMETTAMLFHDEKGTAVARLKLHAGDDAGAVSFDMHRKECFLYQPYTHTHTHTHTRTHTRTHTCTQARQKAKIHSFLPPFLPP